MTQAGFGKGSTRQEPSNDLAPLTQAMAEARDALMAAQQSVAQEIRAYPMPISGCDAQFNHLLALRQQVSAALVALDSPAWIPTSRHPD